MLTGNKLDDKKILLVEDSRASTNSIETLIEENGGNLEVYNDLSNQDLILADFFDIAILDIFLKNESTLEFIKMLKKRSPSTRIIVVSSSTSALAEDPEAAASVDYLVEKPFTSDKILSAIDASLYLPLKNKNVLIIDDAKVSLRALGRIVTKLGGMADSYSDLSAENEILKNKYSLAILDLMLKDGVTTIDFIQKLKSTHPETYIFILSAMPSAMHAYPEILSNAAFIFQKPISDQVLERNLIKTIEHPYADRRKNPRKPGMAQVWVAEYNLEEKKAELFESPALLDLSNHGISYQSFLTYKEGEHILCWINYEGDIIEIIAKIIWSKTTEKITQYGAEIMPKLSSGFSKLQEFVTRITNYEN